jgi:formate dehydrogenase major subunit
VTAVQVSPSNGPSDWQVEYRALSAENRRIEVVPAGE